MFKHKIQDYYQFTRIGSNFNSLDVCSGIRCVFRPQEETSLSIERAIQFSLNKNQRIHNTIFNKHLSLRYIACCELRISYARITYSEFLRSNR